MKRRICLHLALLLALTFALLPAWPGTGAQAQGTIYVDWEAGGANDGSSWGDAFTDLQGALATAGSGDEIWVAAGSYTPTSGTDRAATFQLLSGVVIYGGFDPSVAATGFDDRDWVAHPTILSGDLGAVGDPNDNSYHVVTGSGTDGTAVLDGFTLTQGNADLASAADCGGGMFNDNGSPTVHNVILEKNLGIFGAAMCNRDASHPELVDATIFSNTASGDGGGMYNDASHPILTDVTFVDNTSLNGGGGMANQNSSPTLTRVVFEGNRSETYGGGGMLNRLDSNPTLTDVVFYNNYAGPDQHGGGMFSSGGTANLTTVTFRGNHASWGGGLSTAGSLHLTNCAISANLAERDGGGIFVSSSALTLENSLVEGNRGMWNGGGLANSGGSVQVSSSRIRGNIAQGGAGLNSSAGGMTLISGSTFQQNEAMEGGAIRNDGSGHMDIINTTISGNRASNAGGGIMTTSTAFHKFLG